MSIGGSLRSTERFETIVGVSHRDPTRFFLVVVGDSLSKFTLKELPDGDTQAIEIVVIYRNCGVRKGFEFFVVLKQTSLNDLVIVIRT
jgi:hypothetical protein